MDDLDIAPDLQINSDHYTKSEFEVDENDECENNAVTDLSGSK